jgi:hypothetical protein
MVLYAYMCYVCVFSLRRESSDMILKDKPFISEVILSKKLLGLPGSIKPDMWSV